MMDWNEKTGLFYVLCDEKLFHTKEIEIPYTLYQRETDDFSESLIFIRNHFSEMYCSVLKSLFTAYNRYPTWDIWNEATKTFMRIELQNAGMVHPYIGMPTIEIVSHEKKVLFGFSFWRENKMSIEHGLCAVFEKDNLLFVSDHDFCNIVRYWEYRDNFNILKGRNESAG